MRRALAAAFRAGTSPLMASFRAALADPASVQRALADRLARRASRCAYGRHHGLVPGRVRPGGIRDALPLCDYEALAPWVERQQREEGPVLTPDRVRHYEPTSGSSGPRKLIPYTRALQATFARMFALWTHDLLAHIPRLGEGRVYFSISPQLDPPAPTARGRPVGLADDSEYLGGWRAPMRPFLLDTAAIAQERDGERFQWQLLRALVAASDLEVISVWNPSFLLVLLDLLEARREELLAEAGRRAHALRGSQVDVAALWPRLKLVSAWQDANAAPLARALSARLAHAHFQGKGLLATEAALTLPLWGVEGGVPLVRDVFFEFMRPDGTLALLHEVERGEQLEVIISTQGGLLRYRLGDQVAVVGRLLRTPTLRFLGRGGGVCDLVGEKLAEPFVRDVIERLVPAEASLRVLLPRQQPRAGYVLVLDALGGPRGARARSEALACQVERALMDAHHYRHARALGQLSALEVWVRPHAAAALTRFGERQGLRRGDIKPAYLVTRVADAALLADLQGDAVAPEVVMS